MKNLAKITINGRVQGVWFRAFTRDKARMLKLKGWVRNQPDGTVYTEVIGDRSVIDTFIQELYQGSELSHVDNVDVKWESFDDCFSGFEIRY